MELCVVRTAETFELEVMRDQVNEELRRREVMKVPDASASAGAGEEAAFLPLPHRMSSAGGAQGSAGLTLDNVEYAFRYHPWDRDQQQAGDEVRDLLVVAAKGILRRVPAGPSRTRALNCLVDARMLANAGITHRGRF